MALSGGIGTDTHEVIECYPLLCGELLKNLVDSNI